MVSQQIRRQLQPDMVDKREASAQIIIHVGSAVPIRFGWMISAGETQRGLLSKWLHKFQVS